jgi:hypothetical protein
VRLRGIEPSPSERPRTPDGTRRRRHARDSHPLRHLSPGARWLWRFRQLRQRGWPGATEAAPARTPSSSNEMLVRSTPRAARRRSTLMSPMNIPVTVSLRGRRNTVRQSRKDSSIRPPSAEVHPTSFVSASLSALRLLQAASGCSRRSSRIFTSVVLKASHPPICFGCSFVPG